MPRPKATTEPKPPAKGKAPAKSKPPAKAKAKPKRGKQLTAEELAAEAEKQEGFRLIWKVFLLRKYLVDRNFGSLSNVFYSDAVIELPYPMPKIEGLKAIKKELKEMRLENFFWPSMQRYEVSITSPTTGKMVTYYGDPSQPGTVWVDDYFEKGPVVWKIKRREIYLPNWEVDLKSWYLEGRILEIDQDGEVDDEIVNPLQ